MLPFIDFHCDTLYKLSSTPGHFFFPEENAVSHVFFDGLRSSGSLLQCFALFTDLHEASDSSPLSGVLRQISCFRHILSHSEGQLLQIKNFSQLKNCISQNRIGVLLTLEESCLSECPLSLLPELYTLGVRIATLTWDYSTRLATPDGLTSDGFDFLAEAERLGILIDVSHLSDAGFRDVASHCKRPFLASHSNARTICKHPRNLTDDMLRTIGNHGGVIGLTLHEPFLISSPSSPEDVQTALIRHAKHILSVAGSDALVLGTDFDGTPGNRCNPNISHLFLLENIFKKGRIPFSQIEKIFYGNALRFFETCL